MPITEVYIMNQEEKENFYEEKRKIFQETKERMEKEQKEKNHKDFLRIRDFLKKQDHNNHNKEYIYRQLHEKENLRKVFIALIKTTPALISEVYENVFLTKPTIYSQLFKLKDYKLCDRVFVMQINEGTVSNEEIKEKFSKWSENMPDNLKRYYLAKASYWVITEFGKEFCENAINFENEFRTRGVKNEK